MDQEQLDQTIIGKGRQQRTSTLEIEGFEIIEELGKGGMSSIYKARQTLLDRLVAVKVLSELTSSEEESYQRFHNEAKLTS